MTDGDHAAQGGTDSESPVDRNNASHLTFQDWHDDVLDRLLPISSIVILPALVTAIVQALNDPKIERLGVSGEVIIYALLLFLSFYRRLGTRKRSWGLMLLVYLAGVVTMGRGGLAGDGRVYFVALVVLSIVLINTRAGIFFAVLSVGTYLAFSALAQFGILTQWLIYKDNPLNGRDWLLAGLTMSALIGVLIYVSHRAITFQLQILQTVKKTALELAGANQQLERMNLSLEHTVEKRTAELREANENLAFLAMHDTLTGLPNRILLYDRLKQAILLSQRDQRRFALLFIDLDNFKAINDQYGHDMGDYLLVAVAKVLQQSTRESDTVARLGGDEFVMLLSGVQQPDSVERVVRALQATFSQPLRVSGVLVKTSASIGVSLYPRDGADPETLLQNADTAMYAVKGAGKNNFQFFQAEK
jgi:diguanylate cyclase (GGDEF)-like protein